ncbi:sigma-54-dependent Fis family transcriptional regulator [Lactobacillus sp. UCMA15818]|uniref:sigma-54-dependent Fis family transcriptional regulator n=1 Tax=Lactobacillus sp. UCMA15818 TaxID=2583394 RepID=UPI0025B0DA6D|nr:sigma-54-dependent Fis family transcriptional regulator [Lactobacillus sp. UCMA15818]MDN2454314.1 hypothetical protein [Lactobacillus sp. UCMA15818]
MTDNVLGIFPYEGLKNTTMQLLKEYPMIKMDCYVGDLQRGLEIAESKLASKNYCLIVSRGGTSNLLSANFKIPVVDIGVSKYDIVHAVQGTLRLSKVAIVGFEFLIDKAKFVIADFQKNIKLYKINSEEEVKAIIKNLKKNNFDAVIGDMVTTRIAKELGLNSILISSDIENIQFALTRAIDLMKVQSKFLEAEQLLKYTLKNNKEAVVVLDDERKIKNYYNMSDPFKMLPHIKKRIQFPKMDNKAFKSRGVYYTIQQDEEEPHFLFINQLVYYNSSKNSTFSMDSFVSDCFDIFFNTIYSSEELSLFDNSLSDHLPIVIAGQEGTGKRYLLKKLLESKKNLSVFDSTNVNLFRNFVSSPDSPLFNENNIIVFYKFDTFSQNTRDIIINFINQTLLYKRSKLFFTYENNIDLNTESFISLKKQPRFLKTQDIRNLSSNQVNHLIPILLNRFNREFGKNIISMTDLAFDSIINKAWDRNISQFISALEYAYSSATEPYVNIKEINFGYKHEIAINNLKSYHKQIKEQIPKCSIEITKESSLKKITKEIVEQTLIKNNYNKTLTAKELEISRSTLWRILKESSGL